MNIVKRNNVKIFGKGIPIIFAHGYGCDQNMWRYIAPEFEKDYQVVLFDLVGAGNSDNQAFDKRKYSALQGYADDVLEICEHFNFQNAVFVGDSVSAMIGVLAAIRQPSHFSRLVLIGPSPCYINKDDYFGGFSRHDIDELLESMDSNYLGWSKHIAPVIMGNPNRTDLTEELTNSFCRADPEIARHFARVTFLSDNRSDLHKLTVPSLILQCSDDMIAPIEVGQYTHRKIKNSNFLQLNATGHCPNLSAPQETTTAIRSFLREFKN